MGTNYYLKANKCPHCGKADESLHIGKSSAGWCFSLRVHPEHSINDLEDWKIEFAKKNVSIEDEYGGPVDVDDMIDRITKRSWPSEKNPRTQAYLKMNSAVEGPNGLLRHAIGRHCIAHGAGTWDLLNCEFS